MIVIHELADGRIVDSIEGYVIPPSFTATYKIAEKAIKDPKFRAYLAALEKPAEMILNK